MNRIDLEKIRSVPIGGVITRLGREMKKNRCLCFFHDDHNPSCYVNALKNTFVCYSCGARGDPIDLVRRHLNLSFNDACRWLANESNIILTEYKPQTTKTKTMTKTITFPKEFYENVINTSVLGGLAEDFLYEERKLDPEVIKALRIGAINGSGAWFNIYWMRQYTKEQLRSFGVIVGEGIYERCFFDCPCLLFPYFDVEGQLIGIQSRYIGDRIVCVSDVMRAQLERDKRYAKRFRFTQGSHPCIYNQPVLKTLLPDDELWIAEGITDCLALLSSGKKAIAIPSATLLTYANKELLHQYASHHTWNIFPDQDAAGERLYEALLSAANECGAALVRHQLPEGCKDFSDYWKSITPKP